MSFWHCFIMEVVNASETNQAISQKLKDESSQKTSQETSLLGSEKEKV